MAESLDLKSLRVVDLKEELGKRNLSKNGKKDELLARLTEALAQEEAAAAPAVEEVPTAPAPTTAEEVTAPAPAAPAPTAPAPTAADAANEDEVMKTSVDNKVTTTKDAPADSATATTTNKPLPVESAKTAPPPTSAPLESATTIEGDSVNVSEDSASSKDQTTVDEGNVKSKAPLKRKHEEDSDLQQDKRSKPAEVESTPKVTTDDKATATGTGTTATSGTKPGDASSTTPDTNSTEQLAICIKGFVRPLITRNLHQFVNDFGNIKRFWIDPIKTHCYVIYETLEQANTAFEKIDGAVYPPSTGKNVSVIRLTSTQAAKLMDREQEVAEKHGRVNWEKLLERVLNNEDIDDSLSTEQGAKGSSPSTNVKHGYSAIMDGWMDGWMDDWMDGSAEDDEPVELIDNATMTTVYSAQFYNTLRIHPAKPFLRTLYIIYHPRTSSFGKRHTKSHTLCRRCGDRSYHKQKKTCAQCGYPAAKIRSFNWSEKGKRRKTTGTGRMRYLKVVHRRFKNGFREGTQAKKQESS
ncbi:hypothetical protein [Absidia glauca]|uniref:SAP domain-containing protein n=1 Tax=Absidia glauca TaxID=4829 RepID=A0A168KYW7_ABSGL|nr:hypothetical protein [Absidia glauca]